MSIQPLLGLKSLRNLAISTVELTSIEGIQSLDQLDYLRIAAAPDIDLSPLTKMDSLNTLDIFNQEMQDYSILLSIPNLKHLYCTLAQKDAIEALGQPILFEFHAS